MSPEEVQALKQELEELKRARRSGVKRVVFNERDVTYKSDDDMRQAQRELEGEIAEAEAGPQLRRRRRTTLVAFRSRY